MEPQGRGESRDGAPEGEPAPGFEWAPRPDNGAARCERLLALHPPHRFEGDIGKNPGASRRGNAIACPHLCASLML